MLTYVLGCLGYQISAAAFELGRLSAMTYTIYTTVASRAALLFIRSHERQKDEERGKRKNESQV